MQLKDRVHNVKAWRNNTTNPFQPKHWAILIVSIALPIIFVNGVVYIINERIIEHNNPNLHKKAFSEFENPYNDIIKDTVPFIRSWYRNTIVHNNQETTLLKICDNDYTTTTTTLFDKSNNHQQHQENNPASTTQEPSCLSRWFHDIQSEPQLLQTNNTKIFQVLQNMGLQDLPLIRSHISKALEQQYSDTDPFMFLNQTLYKSSQCTSHSNVLLEFACAAESFYPQRLQNLTDIQKKYINDVMHVIMVYEILTPILETDFAALHQVIDVMTTTQNIKVEQYFQQYYTGAKLEFRRDKYQGMAQALKVLGTKLSTNDPIWTGLQEYLQVNILEAVKLDILKGHDDNARIGIALASAVSFNPVTIDHIATWRLSQDWVEAYITWNMAFISGNTPISLFAKLLTPTVACTMQSEHGQDFMVKRVISLSLSLMLLYQPLDGNDMKLGEFYQMQASQGEIDHRYELTNQFGDINMKSLQLPNPSRDTVEKMLYHLCQGDCREATWKVTDTSFTDYMDDTQYQVFVGLVTWAVVLFTGFGCEMFVFIFILQKREWTDEIQSIWVLAQFLFPILALISLGLAMMYDRLALIFMVLCLWKFGFPETIMYLCNAFSLLLVSNSAQQEEEEEEEKKNCHSQAMTVPLFLNSLADLLNGLGNIIHHGAASLAICMIVVGVVKPGRETVAPILILILQHCFLFVQRLHVPSFVVIQILLELEFEWSIISKYEYYIHDHWSAGVATGCMLVGHWLYFIAGGMEFILHWSCCLSVLETDERREHVNVIMK